MKNPLAVKIGQPCQNLPSIRNDDIERKRTVPADERIHGAPGTVFTGDAESEAAHERSTRNGAPVRLGGRAQGRAQIRDDVGMLQLAHDSNFLEKIVQLILLNKVQLLYGHERAAARIEGTKHRAKRAATKGIIRAPNEVG